MATYNANDITGKWAQIYQLVDALTEIVLQYDMVPGLLYAEVLYDFKMFL